MVGLDAFARMASYPTNWAMLPLIVLFDVKAAFLSVAHQRLFLIVLERSGAPSCPLNFPIAHYTSVRFVLPVEGSLEFARFAISCVLTGCPLSAFLFCHCIKVFLLDFHKTMLDKSYGVLICLR